MFPRKLFLLPAAFFLLTGMGGGGAQAPGAQLKPEIRLKIYNDAIRHYEKAQALYGEGKKEEALRELRKATNTVRAFPEAYALTAKIYLELGKQKEAEEQEGYFDFFGGNKGASLFKVRDETSRVVKRRIKIARAPDVQKKPAFKILGILTAILFLGMAYDIYRKNLFHKERRAKILLESFPGDEEEEEEIKLTWLFKLCLLLIPAPLILFLLLSLGLRYYSDLVPVLLFGWIIIDLAIYLIFFADFSDFGGSGGGRGGGGFRGPGGLGSFL